MIVRHYDLIQQVSIVEKMADKLERRGLDASTVWSSWHLFFGHTRLVVVNPVGGVQLMPITKTIVNNGELYYKEEMSKKLLKRGYSFQSFSVMGAFLTRCIISNRKESPVMQWKSEDVLVEKDKTTKLGQQKGH